MKNPLKDALLGFTNGSSNGRAAYVISGKGYVVLDSSGSRIISCSYGFPDFYY